MLPSAVRVLVNHRDPAIRRRLRQALLGEPDLEVLDTGEGPVADLAGQVHALQPDIILTDTLDDGDGGRRVRDVLLSSLTPARVVLVNGHAGLTHPSTTPVDLILPETASQADIVRLVRTIQAPSTYVRYLPAILTRDEFMGRFLRIFESVLAPVDQQIDGLERYLDPDLAPEQFLPWLASWLSVTVDDRWPRPRQVALIRAAPDLHRWRGTRRGLIEHLRLYLDVTPEIEETAGGLRLGPSTQLGLRTVLGESGPRHHFVVTLRVPDPAAIDYTAVAALIDAQKPAHCTYSLVILPATGGPESSNGHGPPDGPDAPEDERLRAAAPLPAPG
jgi:phage tail-like protein